MKRVVKIGTIAVLSVLLFGSSGPAGDEAPDRREAGGKQKAERKVLRVGETAPDFELTRLDLSLKQEHEEKSELQTVKLSSLLDKQPIVLVFSSYT